MIPTKGPTSTMPTKGNSSVVPQVNNMSETLPGLQGGAFPAAPMQGGTGFLQSPMGNFLSGSGGVEMAGKSPDFLQTLRDQSAFMDNRRLSPQQKRLQDTFKAMQQPDVQAQFSPVQFGSPAGAGNLSQFIAALKQGSIK